MASASSDGAPPRLRVAVACSAGPGRGAEVAVELAAPASAFDAIRASGVLERFPEIDLSVLTVGVWGRACALGDRVVDGDRVEIYWPLRCDPNEARRLRAREKRAASRR